MSEPALSQDFKAGLLAELAMEPGVHPDDAEALAEMIYQHAGDVARRMRNRRAGDGAVPAGSIWRDLEYGQDYDIQVVGPATAADIPLYKAGEDRLVVTYAPGTSGYDPAAKMWVQKEDLLKDYTQVE